MRKATLIMLMMLPIQSLAAEAADKEKMPKNWR
jgi:hypothetical protein